jgi:ankyrin repeat protein
VLFAFFCSGCANYRAGGEFVNVPADADDPSTGRQNLLAGVTALHVAAENGYLSICKLLLEHGADSHLPRSDGVLPADIARDNAHKEVAALIDSYASHTRTPAH